MAVGRPPKYTPERLSAILADISDRIPYSLAAECNGIDESTLYDWIRTGQNDISEGNETVLSAFSQSIKRIESKLISNHLNKMNDNENRWQADAWILERRWHKLFGANVLQKEQEERLAKLEEQLKAKE